MSGLNLEGVEPFAGETGDDVVIDLEVTSNRGDCLGHVGVAREIAVLYGEAAQSARRRRRGRQAAGTRSPSRFAIRTSARSTPPGSSAACTVGESPAWVKDRLAALGQRSVNNVADATNLAMLETGQPFHAFDLAKLGGGRIVVRRSETGRDVHRPGRQTYELPVGTGVIADERQPVAVAGVMGSEDSEIGPDTVDVLLEAADFSPRSGAGRGPASEPAHRRQPPVRTRRRRRRIERPQPAVRRPDHGARRRDVRTRRRPSPARRRREPDPVPLRFDRVPALLGMAVTAERVRIDPQPPRLRDRRTQRRRRDLPPPRLAPPGRDAGGRT